MLPPAHRMRRRSDFASAVKGGRRISGRLLVLHTRAPQGDPSSPVLVGFVVPRAVGNAVIRNRVQRRLRHLLVPVVRRLPAGGLIVVRVLPAAATASSSELEAELHDLTARLERRWTTERVEVSA